MHPDLDPREVERVADAMRVMSDLGPLTRLMAFAANK